MTTIIFLSSRCRKIVIKATLVIVIVTISFLLLNPFYHSNSSGNNDIIMSTKTTEESWLSSSAAAAPPFSLFVTLTFTAEEYKQQFLNDIAPLVLYVKDYELDTIAYEVLLNDQNPLSVLIIERYKDKHNAFLRIHRNSEPFITFRPKLQSLIEAGYVTMSGQSYYDSEIGFIGR